MSEKLPKGVRLVLKKVGEAQSFQLVEGVIRPQGKFALMPEIAKTEQLGRIKIKLIDKPDQVSTNSAIYQEVTSWTVGKSKAYLDGIGWGSDTPATAQFKLEIGNDIIFQGKKLQSDIYQDIPGIDLAKGDVVKISVKSDGATTIKADGVIQGREVG